jgi:hypothetical protein
MRWDSPLLDEEMIDFAKTLRGFLFNECLSVDSLSATSTSMESAFKETVTGNCYVIFCYSCLHALLSEIRKGLVVFMLHLDI